MSLEPLRSPPPPFRSTDPRSGAPGPAYQAHTDAEVNRILDASVHAFTSWRNTGFSERSRLALSAAGLLRGRRRTLAELITSEMGKLRSEAEAELDKCVFCLEHFAEATELYLANQPATIGNAKTYVTFRPLGPVLGVMPWNYPIWQVVRAAVPAVMAGNSFLLKHASDVPGCAVAIEALFADAGFPRDLVRVLFVRGHEVGRLIADPRVAAVTLTGSTSAGRSVGSAAGGALKKCVLELGGSDPYLVLADADVEAAAEICTTARLNNAGQSCNAGKRFIVVSSLKKAFEQAMVRRFEALVAGDPNQPATTLAPLHSRRARDEVHGQVQRSVAAGAALLTGGIVPDGPGAFYPATILTDVLPGHAAFDEEIFGPVAAIVEARDARHAVDLANRTEFGLGAAVLTRDCDFGERLAAEELEAGVVCVNGNVRSDPRLPFGGVKNSGFGRECSGFGIREFVNVKTVRVLSPH